MSNWAAPLVYTAGSAMAALLGWAAVEPFFQESGCVGRIGPANAFFFPVVIGTIAGFLVAADLWYSRQRSRAVGLAWAGFGVAFAAAYLLQGPAHVLFSWLSPWTGYSLDWRPFAGGMETLAARGVAWAFMASVIGISQGVVTGNWRTSCGAMMGGTLGGLVAGLVFDPLQLLLPPEGGPWGWLTRAVGMVITGGTAGFVAGVMADTAIRGIVRIVSGPLEGYQAVILLSPCLVGCSAGCQVVLRDDSAAGPAYALIQKKGFRFEIRSLTDAVDTWVNGKIVHRSTLTHGDLIRVSGTDMKFLDGRLLLRDGSPQALT